MDNAVRYYGYANVNNPLFSEKTVRYISGVVRNNLRDVNPGGVIVPDENILHAINSVYDSGPKRPEVIISDVIDIITSQVRADTAIQKQAALLTAWSQIYDTDRINLSSHPDLSGYVNRNIRPWGFNMNY